MNEIIRERLAAFRAGHELPELDDAKLFETFAAYCVLHQFHEERFEPELHRTGGGNDLGVDAWGIVINGDLHHDLAGVRQAVEANREMNVVVIALQAKTSASAEGKVVADLADNLRQICARSPISYTASPEVMELHEALGLIYDHQHRLTEHSPRLEVRYVHCGQEANVDLLEKCRSAESAIDEIGRFQSVRFAAVGWRELDRLYKLTNRKVKAKFDWPNRSAIPAMEGVKEAWVGTIPASEFVERLLVDEGGSIRKFLFEDNLREFLGQSNEVNDGIAQTLADPVKRKRFAVLNNGITVIATSFDTSGNECHMSRFQIVNGCQTGHVLFENRDKLTDDVHVKLTVIEPESEGIAADITIATNRQTEIASDDLRADQKIHRDIEEYFLIQRQPRDLYYERRSGQYDARSVTMTRVIKQSQLIQAYASVFRGHVHEASRTAKLRSDPALRIFHADSHPIAYYTAAAIWYQVDWLLRNNHLDRKWKPARFMLMAAAVRRFAKGLDLPQSPRFAERHCEMLLKQIWNRDEVERLVCLMIPHLEKLLETEASKQRLHDLARTKGFTERFLEAVAEVE
ncbi:AIPR family protein [Glycomyces harbinensis]|uniref:AIPR protein n=1 Tax=Glycomyces harbinensis TaxID=58114 RepID=A0A1G6ZXQ6_9ACTN|nr:AIPR family protein [Glycomyces harbinensis]SDE07027.1 AIPR protein [Glycomyces harbinensis]